MAIANMGCEKRDSIEQMTIRARDFLEPQPTTGMKDSEVRPLLPALNQITENLSETLNLLGEAQKAFNDLQNRIRN